MEEGFTLFSSKTVKVRYSQNSVSRYVLLNSSYSTLKQNFSVPPSLDGFQARYIWVVARASSGTARLHCEIEDLVPPTTMTNTQVVNVTGPYDWWIVLKLDSQRDLSSTEQYQVRVAWNSGASVSVRLLSNQTGTDECALGDVELLNCSSSAWIRQDGWMLMSVLTGSPEVHDFELTMPQWSPQVLLGTYRLYLHGRNLPQGRISATLNAAPFGFAHTPAVFLWDPLSEIEFSVDVLGRGYFSGGSLKLTTDLGTIEQSRASYDTDHFPPFFRPFSKLSLYTDAHDRPWGEWVVSSSGWSARVRDSKGVWHALPAEGIMESIHEERANYRLWVIPPFLPSIGFLSYGLRFPWNCTLTGPGPILQSRYSVQPSHTEWFIWSEIARLTAPRSSSLRFIVDRVPEDWSVSSFRIGAGPGGGTPFARIVDSDLEIGGILMGPSSTYLGNISVAVRSSNYLSGPFSYLRMRLGNATGSFFLANDSTTLEAKAASTSNLIPAGEVSAALLGPAGEVFNVVMPQAEGGAASAGPFVLRQVGFHRLIASFLSSDGLRAGARLVEIWVVKFHTSVSGPIVRLSSPQVELRLIPSEPNSVGLAWAVLAGPSGDIQRIGLASSNGSLSGSRSFSTDDPSEVGDWFASFWVNFPDGSDRLVGREAFKVVDDLPPVIGNVTILPSEPSIFDDVKVVFNVLERGSGLNRTWVSYIAWQGQEEAIVEAEPMAGGAFQAVIPRQLPFAQVVLWVRGSDLSGNVSSHGPVAYKVGIPMWLLASLVLLIIGGVLILHRMKKLPTFLQLRR